MLGNRFGFMNLASQFASKLDLLEKKSPAAETQGKTECCRSGICCWRRPGALSREDVPKIAALLGISTSVGTGTTVRVRLGRNQRNR